MRVQTKLIALLCVTIALFFAGLTVMLYNDRERAAALLVSERELEAGFFDRLVQLKGTSLEVFARDYTYWDEMVRFVRTGDRQWAREILDTALPTYQVTAMWVYRTDFSVVYGVDTLTDRDLSLTRESIQAVFRSAQFPHVFLSTPVGLMELRGAPIHPSSDSQRVTAPQGYFLVGRLWDDAYLGELGVLTGLRLRFLAERESPPVRTDGIQFTRGLRGWNGQPVRTVVIDGESAIVREFERTVNQEWVLVGSFALVIVTVVLVFVSRWITRPLRLISQSLDTQTTVVVPSLEADSSEFGHLARLVAQFVQQKVALVAEVAERQRVEEALRKSEERYILAARGTNEGLWDWNLVTDEVFFSPRWKEMLGYADDEIGTHVRDWFSLVHPDDLERLKGELAGHCSGQIPLFEREHRILHKNGTYRWVLGRGVALRNADGQAHRMAGSLSDITDRTMHDPLTGLPNRTLFLERLQRGLLRSRRDGDYLFAVILLDLDHFKLVNDSLGHVAGDHLLRELGRRLEKCLRPGDTIARMGGNEFALLPDDLRDVSDAIRVADRVQDVLATPCHVGDSEVVTTASLGIVFSATGYTRPDELIRDAGTALHRAKALGKGRYEVFDPDMRTRAVRRLEVESDLRRAIKDGEFVLYYQPIVSLASHSVVGFEALIRWLHPDRGFVGPLDFIPIAEESGLIVPIGRWVLETAARQLAVWQGGPPGRERLNITLNLSAKQLKHPDLLQWFEQTLAAHAVRPGTLKIELTESLLMTDPDAAAATLQRLRDLGLRVAIDDFGTGYSSLAYLHRFPIDTLKVDRSFVTAMSTDEGMAIVTTIITLAHGLKMDVVAEGVETREQAEQLQSLGCEFAQGFLYAKAVPPNEAEALIDKSLAWKTAA